MKYYIKNLIVLLILFNSNYSIGQEFKCYDKINELITSIFDKKITKIRYIHTSYFSTSREIKSKEALKNENQIKFDKPLNGDITVGLVSILTEIKCKDTFYKPNIHSAIIFLGDKDEIITEIYLDGTFPDENKPENVIISGQEAFLKDRALINWFEKQIQTKVDEVFWKGYPDVSKYGSNLEKLVAPSLEILEQPKLEKSENEN